MRHLSRTPCSPFSPEQPGAEFQPRFAPLDSEHVVDILGEETADLATTYGAMEHFTLSLTGFKVGHPKAHISRPSGDRTPRGVVPDIAIPAPALEGPEDPLLQQALAIVRR